MSNPFAFKPYGQPSRKMQDLFDVKEPVNEWLPNDSHRQTRWDEFLHSTLQTINSTLWPQWDPQAGTGGEWTAGGVTASEMEKLTEADFAILDGMVQPHRCLDNKPSIPGLDPSCPNHRAFFEEEDARDTNRRVGFSYAMYDPIAPPELKNSFVAWWRAGMLAKEGSPTSVSMQFKLRLQRPRALQVALLQKRLTYAHEHGLSAFTPAMSSGHALQGLIGTGAVMEQVLDRRLPLLPDSWHALRQFAVDIGDRRVMAGIHYPSDNLCSWIIAMTLAPGVFHRQEVTKELWTAITGGQSMVYQTIVSSGNPAYDRALAALHELEPEP